MQGQASLPALFFIFVPRNNASIYGLKAIGFSARLKKKIVNIDELVDKTGISIRTVHRKLNILERDGIIKVGNKSGNKIIKPSVRGVFDHLSEAVYNSRKLSNKDADILDKYILLSGIKSNLVENTRTANNPKDLLETITTFVEFHIRVSPTGDIEKIREKYWGKSLRRMFPHLYKDKQKQNEKDVIQKTEKKNIYDYRNKSAYGNSSAEPHYCENKYILKWWTPKHDKLLANQIKKEQWNWYWKITDKIIDITPSDVIKNWKLKDPLCSRYAWYNILMYFATSRAEKIGLIKNIRNPKWKVCFLCNQKFVEDSLPCPLIERFGINRLNFCSPCLKDIVLQHSGNDKLSKKKILAYLRNLADVLERVPTQNFGEGIDDFREMSDQERLVVLRVLKRKPTLSSVKKLFGSWLAALIEAGILEDGTRRTSRGTQCIAKDGHVCFSLGEKTIDDYLFYHKIMHRKELSYPEGNFRADFVVNGVFIEYFGLEGDPDYDAKIKMKQKICKKHNIRLISIYPRDLVSTRKLELKILSAYHKKEVRSPQGLQKPKH